MSHTENLSTLVIQIQPDLLPAYDEAAILAACEGLKVHKPLIASFRLEEGEDDGRWVNLSFETAEPARVWPLLQAAFYGDGPLGEALRAASMAVCTGEEGWDDYLLLYHFDPDQILDSLEG